VSRTQRALIALGALVALLLIGFLTGASRPQRPVGAAIALDLADLDEPTIIIPTLEIEPTATATLTPSPEPTPTLARREFNTQGENIAKIAPTTFLPGRGPALPGEFVYAGRRLDVYVGRGTFSNEEVASMAIKAEHALNYMQRRFATQLQQRVSVGVYPRSLAPGRGTRGIAYTYGATNVRIYYGAGEDQHNALVILTHELAHALQADAYGKEEQSRADIVLLEGLASFISGEYWLSLSGAPSFQARARELYQAGYRGNLATLGSGSLDVAYDMWAGFVDYLTRTYGWDKFNLLYTSGRGRAAGSADYVGVYGKSFQTLVNEYYETLK
jgi:hypothetical protein